MHEDVIEAIHQANIITECFSMHMAGRQAALAIEQGSNRLLPHRCRAFLVVFTSGQAKQTIRIQYLKERIDLGSKRNRW
jgi:hypothetical protein